MILDVKKVNPVVVADLLKHKATENSFFGLDMKSIINPNSCAKLIHIQDISFSFSVLGATFFNELNPKPILFPHQ